LQFGIRLEDLKGIRSRIEDTASRKFRWTFGNWAFAHLRSCIEYKALRAGVPVDFVDPKYTSQTCSRCQHCEKANRRSQAKFSCRKCGYVANADYNAACTIRLGVQVRHPEKARTLCKPLASVQS